MKFTRYDFIIISITVVIFGGFFIWGAKLIGDRTEQRRREQEAPCMIFRNKNIGDVPVRCLNYFIRK